MRRERSWVSLFKHTAAVERLIWCYRTTSKLFKTTINWLSFVSFRTCPQRRYLSIWRLGQRSWVSLQRIDNLNNLNDPNRNTNWIKTINTAWLVHGCTNGWAGLLYERFSQVSTAFGEIDGFHQGKVGRIWKVRRQIWYTNILETCGRS